MPHYLCVLRKNRFLFLAPLFTIITSCQEGYFLILLLTLQTKDNNVTIKIHLNHDQNFNEWKFPYYTGNPSADFHIQARICSTLKKFHYIMLWVPFWQELRKHHNDVAFGHFVNARLNIFSRDKDFILLYYGISSRYTWINWVFLWKFKTKGRMMAKAAF